MKISNIVIALALVLLLSIGEIALAQAPGQITFTTTDSSGVSTLWRIQAQAGAIPENLNLRLDSIALLPGQHFGPITVSPDGAWYVFYSERFDTNSQGWPGLTIARADFRLVETIRSNGQTLHGEGGQAAAGGTAVVYVDGGGPHTRDLFLVRRQGNSWTPAVCLTTQSPYAWNYWPVLSRDSAKVVFNAGNNAFPSTAICEVRLDGTGFRVFVTKDDGPPGQTSPAVHSAAYAPDGSIVFEAEWGGGERVWRRVGTATPTLVNSSFVNDNSPNVLPDGKIVSLWLGSPRGQDRHEIKVMDANGQNAVMLTDTTSPFYEVDDIGLGCGPSYNPTGVLEMNDVPNGCALFQNYPNPFNPSTAIRFQLPVSRFVVLKVYNVLGQEVATLVNDNLQPGTYEVTFDAAHLASGVYFYRLEAGKFTQTRRMLLIR